MLQYRKLLPVIALAGAFIASEPAIESLYNGGQDSSYGMAYAAQKKPKTQKAPNPLKGSRSALAEQNRKANEEDLTRIKDDDMLERFIKHGYLVPLQGNSNYCVDRRLDDDQAYVRPYTRKFVERLSEQYHSKFGQKLQVNSGIRTQKDQKKLRRRNVNAAPYSGPLASSHMTGATVDITKKKLKKNGIKWLRTVLSDLDRRGVIEATEEKKQSVFHIMVYRDEYADYIQR